MEVPSPARIEIYEGESARLCFEDPAFIRAWQRLYRLCPWKTVFQSSEFVLTWYRLFSRDFVPLVVTSVRDGIMTGILTLAMSKKRSLITGAGAHQAEYHAWLTGETEGESFITEALLTLRRRFSRFNIAFTYIPPDAPVRWAVTEKRLKNRCFMRILRQPLVDITADHFIKKLGTKTVREKIRRLERLGELTFERITDAGTFERILEELIVQYEFRKGAMYGIAPFREEPGKKPLLVELFRIGMLHVTVLRLGNRIIASTVNTVDGKWIGFKGLNAHLPQYSKQSPGLLHLLMLGKMLAEEDMETFDLTPGDDFYKDKLATRHRDVTELWIARSQPARLKRKMTELVKRIIRERLSRKGIDPRYTLTRIRKLKADLLSLPGTGLGLKRRIGGRKKQAYLLEPRKNLHVVLPPVHRDSLADLLQYDSKGSGMNRWDFLKDAMKRFELGEHSYTITDDDGRLLACAWLRGKYSDPVGDLKISQEAELIHSVYLHPDIGNWAQPFLNAVAEDVAAQAKKPGIYLVTDRRDDLIPVSSQGSDSRTGKDSYFQ